MRALTLATIVLLATSVVGCGSLYYRVSANAASSRLEQAQLMGAETQAPYEYYVAREHLRQAQIEAAQASYGDAASYAETAERYAQKAIDTTAAARKDGRAGDAK